MTIVENAWSILCESAIFILLGFLIAALLQAFLSNASVVRYLSGARPRSVFLATLIGLPLPLCSCSVLPTAIMLRKKGASRGSVLSFLISTPETSVTSVLLTYSLVGPLLAIARPVAACVTAVTAGLLQNAVEARGVGNLVSAPADTVSSPASESPGEDACCHGSSPRRADAPDAGAPTPAARIGRGIRFAFVDLFDDIFAWILIGIFAAVAIQVWLPQDVLHGLLGGRWQSMLVMLVIGVPLYVCAEASTPIAAVLLLGGLDPGAALVFLLVGPATNIGSLGVLIRHLGRRAVWIYLSTIVVVAVLMGIALNSIVDVVATDLRPRAMEERLLPVWIKQAGALLFLALGVASARRLRYAQRLADFVRTLVRRPLRGAHSAARREAQRTGQAPVPPHRRA